ncbi:hypothetical protein QTP70_027296 [Hemibagrus guttatus]|uniref:Uncharacterized protein n=1 Tax=Hemibagrus guttatus TaxID=175788 RepID=A0AAE0QTN5_9TELE|nr:hypothetical protein QTP70_027296 [Hemibagrus guttatus]
MPRPIFCYVSKVSANIILCPALYYKLYTMQRKPALDPSDISNYRPNNLHDPNQSGFKAAHSTETALLAVTEQLHAARSAKLSKVLILLNLSAAFDTVNQKTINPSKTELLVIPGENTSNSMKERAEAEVKKLMGSFLTSNDAQLKGDEETRTQAKVDGKAEGVAEESSSKEKERKKRTRRGTRDGGKRKVQVNKTDGKGFEESTSMGEFY